MLRNVADLNMKINSEKSVLTSGGGLQDVRWSKVMPYIENIKLDLVSWRTTIFVEQNTLDIHYLDSSLMSSCIQAQLFDSQSKLAIDDENDLELF